MGAPLYLTVTLEYFSIRITLEQSRQNKTSSSKDTDCVELLLETNDHFRGGYHGKTLQWDLYRLLYTSLVCWIEIGHQKGGFVSVVLGDAGQPESSGTDAGIAGYIRHMALTCSTPAHVQLAPVEAILN